MMQARSIPARRTSSAFTLVEMVLAIVVVSMLVLSLQSATMLMSRSMPTKMGSGSAAASTSSAAELFESDLAFATAVTASTSSIIEITAPDQNGDGQSEAIRYSWSGVSGDPLIRSFNSSVVTLVSDVREFSLVYEKTPRPRTTTYTESAEIQLAGYDNAAATAAFVVDDHDGIGQYFLPVLPSGAVKWRVTRLLVKAARKGGGSGITRVQLRSTSAQLPLAIIHETTMLEDNLASTMQWYQIDFVQCPWRTAGSALCVAFERTHDPEPCQLQYQASGVATSGISMIQTTNGGSTWTASSAKAMCFYVYGTYTTSDPVVLDYQLRNVGYALQSGPDVRNRLAGTARMINQPVVAP